MFTRASRMQPRNARTTPRFSTWNSNRLAHRPRSAAGRASRQKLHLGQCWQQRHLHRQPNVHLATTSDWNPATTTASFSDFLARLPGGWTWPPI
jgi:hypothetical protein